MFTKFAKKLIETNLVKAITNRWAFCTCFVVTCGAVLNTILERERISARHHFIAILICGLLFFVLVLALLVRSAPQSEYIDSKPTLKNLRFRIEVVCSHGLKDSYSDWLRKRQYKGRLARSSANLPMRITPIRIGKQLEISQIDTGFTFANAESIDLSGDGAAVITSAKLTAETLVHIKLLNSYPNQPKAYIARVAWVDQNKGKRCRCGLEFLTKERQESLLPQRLLGQLPEEIRKFSRPTIEEVNRILVATYGDKSLNQEGYQDEH